MRGLFSRSILTWSMMNSVSLGNLFVTMLDVGEFQCPVSLHGCVLNPFCPCFSGLSCPILTGYLRINFQTGSEVTQPEGKLCCCSIPHTEKRLVNGVESIRVTGGP